MKKAIVLGICVLLVLLSSCTFRSDVDVSKANELSCHLGCNNAMFIVLEDYTNIYITSDEALSNIDDVIDDCEEYCTRTLNKQKE